MRNFFEPATASPAWLRQVLSSIRAALGDVWPAPLRLKDYATADLPAAADFAQGLAWNATSLTVTWSDGANWKQPQPLDSNLTTIAGLTATTGNFIVSVSSAWASRTPAQARATLGVTATGADTTYNVRANNLADVASASASRANLGVSATGADTNYCARANNLADVASASSSRSNLGLGGMAVQASNNVAITGGTIAGVTSLDVAGESRCDTLRIDATPTAATPTPTHTVPININGTVYRFPCVI